MTENSITSGRVKRRERLIIREGLDLERTDLGEDCDVAKLFPCEGSFYDEIKMPLKQPLVPKRGPDCVLRENYVPNSMKYHYPRPRTESIMDFSSLEAIFGTKSVSPLKLLECFLTSNGIQVQDGDPKLSDWLSLVELAEASYPMMYLKYVLHESAASIAGDFHALWGYLKRVSPDGYGCFKGCLYIPDYEGDMFTIKEGLILRLVGDEMGILVLRESEEEEYSADEDEEDIEW